ncbi:uncharacterized protein LOC103313598 isoform X2 [Tribolium castaneum]|uniref:Odorant receptor n=1 Tax=Tribolium castaneum TaxID=7070 RepID=D6WUA6_TRICA|nr:PREDICTED: uncharacterized protein LOC103313598 isoform X2 [Tribolium castaneum]EFA07457.1 odorant receptor 198 [Tribolium castaneum]|eukprot:XP_008195491.1 PREDICTED: uncharacterized protein LOC103313598 isoform X2 [Tribolium castaneum]
MPNVTNKRQKRLFSKTRTKSEDPFVMIKDVFVDGGYHPVTKMLNYICLVIHSCSLLLELNYFVHNYHFDLMMKYCCAMSLMGYIIATMLFAIFQEHSAIDLTKDILSLFWPIDYCGPRVKEEIVKKATKINRIHYIVLLFAGALGITMFPIWGDQKEWFLCVQVYQHYFGKWSKIPYYVYFFTYPMLAFSSVRLPFMTMYAIVQIRMQVYLLHQHISEISGEYVYDMKNLQILCDQNYQNEIYDKMRLIISHHIMLKRWMRKLVHTVQISMPVFVLLGTMTSISVLFYAIYSFHNINFILKVRLISVSVCTVLVVYMFSEAGQALSTETTGVFDLLMTCPWYVWNIKNRRILLIFMANSLEPMTFSLAGVTLDYRFALGMLRTSCSYSLILYKLKTGI